MSHARMSASSVAHKSTGGTLQSLPEPVDPVGDAPDYLTFKTVAPLRQRVFSFRDSLICCMKKRAFGRNPALQVHRRTALVGVQTRVLQVPPARREIGVADS